jgi:hypothetical protein
MAGVGGQDACAAWPARRDSTGRDLARQFRCSRAELSLRSRHDDLCDHRSAGPYLKGRWKVLPWTLAAAVCPSRVYLGAHFPLDVLAGAGLGHVDRERAQPGLRRAQHHFQHPPREPVPLSSIPSTPREAEVSACTRLPRSPRSQPETYPLPLSRRATDHGGQASRRPPCRQQQRPSRMICARSPCTPTQSSPAPIRRSGAARESGKCLVRQVQRRTLRRACDRRARLRPPARPGCCPHLRVRGLAVRPASGSFETAELAHQARDQHPECAARGDRPPPAGTPPVAAPARGDLSGPAGPEPAPALHTPYRANRLD